MSTFFEKMCWSEKPAVEIKAQTNPTMLKLISVNVAIATPPIMGIKLMYTFRVCFSPMIILDKITVNRGIVALTAKNQFMKLDQLDNSQNRVKIKWNRRPRNNR